MHIDMNAYFATVEQQADPALRGKPVLVGGSNLERTVVTAASYEAKALGITNGMSMQDALRLCPQAKVVVGQPERYVETTSRFLRIFQDYTPDLEVFSIDEAFLDVTGTEERFGGAVAIARKIKERIRKEIGEVLTCSIGIAPNKLVAKLASDKQKPDGLVVVTESGIPAFMKTVALSDICGIGPRMERHLLNLGIDTVDKLARYPEDRLVRRFGKYGALLHFMAFGRDDSPVHPYWQSPPYRSMGHHYTLPSNTHSLEEVKNVLFKLCEKVGRRLRADHYMGSTVSLTLRRSDMEYFHKQHTARDYMDDGLLIFQEASRIVDNWGWCGDIRMVGVSVSNLVHQYRQGSLLPKEIKRMLLLEAVDRINEHFGDFTVRRARILNTPLKVHVGGYVENKTDLYGRLE